MTTTRHTAAMTSKRARLSRQMDEWAPYGSCQGDLRFGQVEPTDRKGVQELKEVCHGCAVVIDCLAHAMEYPEPDGVWGGMDTLERQNYRDTRRKALRRFERRAAR